MVDIDGERADIQPAQCIVDNGYALGIGVNVYLGKPYQESQLLEVIDQLVESGD